MQTVGYHRALSAEGILSLHPTTKIHDNNIGPPRFVDLILRLETLQTRDRFQQGTVNREGLIAEQFIVACLVQHGRKEMRRDVAAQ